MPPIHQAFARFLSIAALVAPAVIGVTAAVQEERLSDKDVKQLIEDLDHSRDRFEDALDGKLKQSILRGPKGEVNVNAYLDDLQENVKRLKERFTPAYSASKEAETVLEQGTQINTYIKSQPGEIKGGSEWDTMARHLGRLASAYGTTFPLADGSGVRRINDSEVASTAELLAKGADQLKKQLDQEKTMPKPVRDGAKRDLDLFAKQAKIVKSRASGSKPATAETRQLIDTARKVGGFMTAQTGLMPGTTSAWAALREPLDKLQQAYGIR
jgi:hypothetical protein